MKGMQGIAVAAILGLLGVGLNWVYLSQKTRDIDSVSFIGIAAGKTLATGEALKREHLAEVKVPRLHARNLENFAYLWQDVDTVVGIKATRPYQGGDLVLISDYRTPPPELELSDDERLIWIAVDSRSFVPSLVDPGDLITFIVPTTTAPARTDGSPSPLPVESTEMIGPFKVGSLGNRLGSRDVMQANRLSPVQERQIGIIVRREGSKLEKSAMALIERLNETGYRNIGVALHPKKK
jgi:hypothetical protein